MLDCNYSNDHHNHNSSSTQGIVSILLSTADRSKLELSQLQLCSIHGNPSMTDQISSLSPPPPPPLIVSASSSLSYFSENSSSSSSAADSSSSCASSSSAFSFTSFTTSPVSIPTQGQYLLAEPSYGDDFSFPTPHLVLNGTNNPEETVDSSYRKVDDVTVELNFPTLVTNKAENTYAASEMIRSNSSSSSRKKKKNTSAMVAPLELEEKAMVIRKTHMVRTSMIKTARNNLRGNDVQNEDEDGDGDGDGDEAIPSPPVIDLLSSPAARFLLQVRMPGELSTPSGMSTAHMAAIPFLWEDQPGRPKQSSPPPSPPPLPPHSPLDLIKLPSPSPSPSPAPDPAPGLNHIPLPPRLLLTNHSSSPVLDASFSSSSRSSYITSTVPSSSSSPVPSSRKLNVASLVNIFCRSAAKAQQRSDDNCDGSNQKKMKKRKTFPTTSYSFHGDFRKNDRVSGPMSTMTIAESSISSLLPLGTDGCVEESVCNPVSSQGSHSHSDPLKVQSKLMVESPSRSGIPSSQISNNRKEMKQKKKKKKKGSSSFFLKLPRTGSRVIVAAYKAIRRALRRKRTSNRSKFVFSHSTLEYHNLDS